MSDQPEDQTMYQVVVNHEAVPSGDDLREELDRRLAAYHADPSTARPWADIKAELFDRK